MGRKSIGATGAVEHRGQIPSVVLTIRSGDWQVEHFSQSGVMSMQRPFRDSRVTRVMDFSEVEGEGV